MRLWDKLLPQTMLKMNLLRQPNIALTVSAYQYVHGNFDYNKMPLAPLGCTVQLYESNTQRGTWAEHSTDRWYTGTSTKHYECHRIYVQKTRREWISDTVYFKHKYITQPTLLPVDTIVKTINDLTHALKGKKNVKGKAQIKTLEKINELINNVPKTLTINRENHVTFNETTAPPNKTNATNKMQTTTPKVTTRALLTKATINKPIQNKIPTPGCRANQQSKRH
jgi:hypothetical protein